MRGPTSGFLATVSFRSILLTTRLNKVREVVILYETSIIFAVLFG
jgi:hypothetical protein